VTVLSSDLLLLLAVVDLKESGDHEVGEYLEHLLGAIEDDLEDIDFGADERDSLRELREVVIDQMVKEAPDRDEMGEWLFEYEPLLPPSMDGLADELDRFDTLLESVFEEDETEELDRVKRFVHCVDLLEGEDWMGRSKAARGLGTLEEELFTLRDDYTSIPFEMEECDAHSVVARIHLLDAFETWQKAFRQAHEGQLDEAVDSALEGASLFVAVERWTQERTHLEAMEPETANPLAH
jgi:hypothetical protein